MITKVKETFTETEDYMTEQNKLDSLAAVSISVPLSILFIVNKDIIEIYIGVIVMVFIVMGVIAMGILLWGLLQWRYYYENIVMGVIAMGILLWGYYYGGNCYGDIAKEVLLWGSLLRYLLLWE